MVGFCLQTFDFGSRYRESLYFGISTKTAISEPSWHTTICRVYLKLMVQVFHTET